ncbi:sugar phosphate isomerase/epimerase family protein [Peribacillus loiseleuriae]|uniref:sugar phosphate isomerase/epimerase family protein n=1 Tax=Peribacillus loiseleuriae TaxID=1679170 RepID=UPI003CFE5E94
MGKIGLQLYSVRESAGEDFLGTVSRVADMGYEGIQFAGFFKTPAKDLKRILNEERISTAGSHIGLDVLIGDKIQETIAYNLDIGNDLIICPFLPEESRNTSDDYQRTAEQFNKIGQICKDNGLTFAYHNHNFEFDTYDGITGFDLLFGNTDPALVKVELDCYWATYAGYDPRDIIKKYGNRVVSLHIKDMTEENGNKRSSEIGSGTLDIDGLLQVGNEYGVNWFVVEQEQFDGDPMVSAKLNIDHLTQLLK